MNAVSIWWLLIVVNKIISPANANWITGNLCWSMPCLNGGSCFGSAYTYLCICPIHYSGALCEKRLGICQENPCGNRGSCIETSLTSFECRCYYDYMGSTCEQHVPKHTRNIWSSLIPSHTRVLFNMLKDAYFSKIKQKSTISSETDQIDFIGLLAKNDSVDSTSIPTTEEIDFTTEQNQLIESEHVIPANEIQLEKIFPNLNTRSKSNMNTNENFPFHNPTKFVIDMTSTPIIENHLVTTEIEQIQTTNENFLQETTTSPIISSTSILSLNDSITADDLTTENVFEQTNNTTEPIYMTTTATIDSTVNIYNTMDDNDSSIINTSEPPSTTRTTTISQNAHSQLLYNLCRKILSQLSPNASSSAVAAEINKTLLSYSSPINNDTADKLAHLLNQYLTSSTTTTTSIPSTVAPIIINGMRPSPMILRRIEMDDALDNMNNNDINSEDSL
ncbi:unnamed protein product [Rotaria socialis]|uniref:EGF-like domain-containing protein n=1 Tax=Rotaria socialis TaxID=392032 RepID=A0A817QUQ3_9BILA|nr:unnamed protein product [Rotaria socialis]CAF4428021.1 unnamed protein product [Rotaria socialis]